MGELALIQQIRARADRYRSGLALGIGDDCAILRPPRGHEIVVTTDFSLEGLHYRRDWHPPRTVGYRALTRGLSDLAAMGARPLAAFLSLALPGEMLATRKGQDWVQQFLDGLLALSEDFHVPLAGGDTSESPCGLVIADIVLVGSAPIGRSLRRSGARAGDLLYVTGSLGAAASELADLTEGRKPKRLHQPMPRVRVGLALVARRLASAAIDLSDGLSTDLTHLCEESRLGAELSASSLPVAPSANLTQALHGGDDYELLFSARPSVKMPRTIAGIPITSIGRLAPGSGIHLAGADGKLRLLKPQGWEHFRRGV